MHDALENTFDAWWAAQRDGGGLAITLVLRPDAEAPLHPSDEPAASLSLSKTHVFADRYVPGVLDERRLIIPLRAEHHDASPEARWQVDGQPQTLTAEQAASLAVLVIRQWYFDPPPAGHFDRGLSLFTRWWLAMLDHDAGPLLEALRRLEPRASLWWAGALHRAGQPTAAERAWMWQAGGPVDQGPADASIHALMDLMGAATSSPADRLGLCRRAQQVFDRTGFRDFDLQTNLLLARCAALVDLGYWVDALECSLEVERRLVANPGSGTPRQAMQLGSLVFKAGGAVRAARIFALGLRQLLGSGTARLKLHRAWTQRRLRSRRPRLPQHADVGHDQSPPIRRVALVRLDKLGDLVTMQPIVQRVRERLPDAAIDIYVSAGLESIVPLLVPGAKGIGVSWKKAETFEKQLKQWAAGPRYDVLIDLLEPDTRRGALLCRALPADAKVGFDSPARKEWFTHRVPTPGRPMHLIDRTATLLRPLGLAVPDDAGWAPTLSLPSSPTADPKRRLREAVGDGPWVGLHVGAGWKFKRWYPERFAAVAKRLADERGLKIAVLCGPDERPIAESVAKLVGPAAAVVSVPLPELPGVMRACELMLVNDSGPMHLAAAVGVPTVVAWGPGDRTLFEPRAQGQPCIVVADQPRCANCPQEVDSPRCPMGYRYEDVPCLTAVREDAVWEACVRALDGRKV